MTGWRRIEVPAPLAKAVPTLRAYQREVDDGHLSVFAGPEPDGWHLSISHRRNNLLPGRYPTWDEIRQARYAFVPHDITMALLLPPESEYVNIHETTFHLWQIAGDH